MWMIALLWWVSWMILMGYFFFIFRPRSQKSSDHQRHDSPGVSVVIAVKNDVETLIRHLPAILSQTYPKFEVIVVNDHSHEAGRMQLEAMAPHTLLKVIHSEGPPGKKHALIAGIEKSGYDWILCTDADGQPISDQWIRCMMDHRNGADMVLGYSPYATGQSLLSAIVRFETTMTAIQYIAWALVGRPYMGVGRNLLYAKALFTSIDPYRSHGHIPYGDDDLWVQQAATKTRVAVCYHAKAHILSDMPASWTAWWRQKHRHLSAAHQYDRAYWWQPGLLGVALILHWGLWPVLLFSGMSSWVIGAGVAGIIIRWWIYHRWTRELHETQLFILYPVFEWIYTLYLSVMGLITLVTKKKTWN